MLKCLIALTSLLSAGAVAAPAWTWVDEQGRRHYSDRPVEGAVQIEISTPQTFAGSGAPQAARQTPTPDEPPAVSYAVLDVISPTQGQTITNTGAEMTVEVATYPALQSAHRIVFDLDGERLPVTSRSLTTTLPDIFRGEHTLAAAIVDADGNELARSSLVTFYMRQQSGQAPLPQTVAPARPQVSRPPTAPPAN
jgi:hypothetical protein